ncbi:hypothetical protein THAOC_29983, partial [Thalassiosira oceanica]
MSHEISGARFVRLFRRTHRRSKTADPSAVLSGPSGGRSTDVRGPRPGESGVPTAAAARSLSDPPPARLVTHGQTPGTAEQRHSPADQ